MAKKATKEILNVARYKLAEPSKTIVDLKQFNGSITQKILGKYRTFMCLNKIEGQHRDFKRAEFSEKVKNLYNQMRQEYPKMHPKEMTPFLSSPLLDTYKTMVKTKQLLWQLEEDCNKASIVQARLFNDKMSTTYSSRVWYQITCEYQFKNGNKKYHIVEKKITDPFWRFCYIDQ